MDTNTAYLTIKMLLPLLLALLDALDAQKAQPYPPEIIDMEYNPDTGYWEYPHANKGGHNA